jgi:hypothetical protein
MLQRRRSTRVFASALLSTIAAALAAGTLSAQQPGARQQAPDTSRAAAQGGKSLDAVGFTARAHSGNGEYMTETQIAQEHPARVTDLFTNVRGVRVDYSTGYPVLEDARTASGSCLKYVVDGVSTAMADGGDLNNFLRPDGIAAIEVYAPAQTPDAFRGDTKSDCEVIVIWTKDKIRG